MFQKFEREHAVKGEKFAAKLLKECKAEDPRVALIASAMTLCCAARACGVNAYAITSLVQSLESSLNDSHSEYHAAMSQLIE